MGDIKTREATRDIKKFDRSTMTAKIGRPVADTVKKSANRDDGQEQKNSQSGWTYATDCVSDTSKKRIQNAAKPLRSGKGAYTQGAKAKRHLAEAKRQLQIAKGTIKRKPVTARKTIKHAGRTPKAAKRKVKAAKRTVKTTKHTVRAAPKTTHGAAKATKAAVKMGVAATKVAIKASFAVIKAIIAATKAIMAFLAFGEWVIVLIIAIAAVVATIFASPFAIFFGGWGGDNADEPDARNITEVIVELTTEFHGEADRIKGRVSHDTVDVAPIAINWQGVIAVFVVDITMRDEDPIDALVLDADRVDGLRDILNRMAWLEYEVTENIRPSEDPDEDPATSRHLAITFHQLSVEQMVEELRFDAAQRETLDELLSDEHADLWAELLGGGGFGTGESTGHLIWPVPGFYRVSSYFGNRLHPIRQTWHFHSGIDIAGYGIGGARIVAADGGVVVMSRWNGTFGNYIRIDHGNGFITSYAHNRSNLVVEGQRVSQGDVIGLVGTTGSSTGNHLHFEVRVNGRQVNPLLHVSRR